MVKKRRSHRKKLKNPLNTNLSNFYFNFKVLNSNNENIGYVFSVINYGASDILIITTEDRELMLPLIDDAIIKVDMQKKLIFINEEYAT